MSNTSKEEILANFQACSGIEDIEEAMVLLKSCSWDLTVALNNIFQDDSEPRVVNEPVRPIPIFPVPAHQEATEVIDLDSPSDDVSPILEFPPSVASTSTQPISGSSTNTASNGVFDINIEMHCGGATRGSSFPLEVPCSYTVGDLQTMLQHLVGINPCNQVLEGFNNPVQSTTLITPELLPSSKTLTLNISSNTNYYLDRVNCTPSDSFLLLIHDEKSKKDYRLSYPGSRSIRSVKQDLASKTNIPVRRQAWNGWPPNSNDNTNLNQSGISKEHHFTVSPMERTPRVSRKVTVIDGDSQEDSSNDEFEDACDIIPDEDFLDMTDVPPTQRTQSLIPSNVEGELTGVLSFVEQFNTRFGSSTPQFFQGTLEDAVKESLLLSARRRKLLAVYLHHDGSVLSNVFCSQALCHASIIDYLTANFVTWGWDLTHESNKATLLNIISNHFGLMAPMTIRNFSIEKLPALLLITRNRGTNEVLSVIHGNSVLDEVMTSLMHATDLFDDQRRTEIIEEDAREQRESVISEQNAAYHMSLEADRAKEEVRRISEMEVREEKERKESERQQSEAIKEAVRISLEFDLEPEPADNCTEPVTILKFRLPNEEPFNRRFRMEANLQAVLNYLCVKGYPADEYKCHQAWPRRDITNMNSSQTLSQIGMSKQETLTIEKRDLSDD